VSFDLFRHRRVAIFSLVAHDLFSLKFCSWGRVLEFWYRPVFRGGWFSFVSYPVLLRIFFCGYGLCMTNCLAANVHSRADRDRWNRRRQTEDTWKNILTWMGRSDKSVEKLEGRKPKECVHNSKGLSPLEWYCHHKRAISLISTRSPWRHLQCLDCSTVKLGVDKLRWPISGPPSLPDADTRTFLQHSVLDMFSPQVGSEVFWRGTLGICFEIFGVWTLLTVLCS
jgi:hypothetical protein